MFLHGPLKKLHDGPIEVVADTIAEAIKIVTSQIAGFAPNAVTGYKRLQVAGVDKLEDFFREDDREEIHLMPAFNGGKQGGFLQILIGAVLIAASFIPGLQFMAPLLMKVGVMLLLGGILQLLSAPPRDRGQESIKSHYLGSPKNTVAIGTRIPILYGKRKIGGHYLSFNISAVDVAV